MKTALFWLGLALIATAGSWMIWQKEHTLAHGRTVLLELRPRDPRSLMQGDYMALTYALSDTVPTASLQRRGTLVLKLDPNHIGTFSRMDDGTPPAPHETIIQYRRHHQLEIGAESYFFQEGTGDTYAPARYAELKVSRNGECLLTALLDENRQRLEPK